MSLLLPQPVVFASLRPPATFWQPFGLHRCHFKFEFTNDKWKICFQTVSPCSLFFTGMSQVFSCLFGDAERCIDKFASVRGSKFGRIRGSCQTFRLRLP